MSPVQSQANRTHFYSIMSGIVALLIIAGFTNTYGRRFLSDAQPISRTIHIHASIFSLWVAVFIAQCLLVAKRKIQAHMRLGTVAIVLAFAMLVSGVATALESARHGHLGIPGVEFMTPNGFLLLNLASAWVFFVLVMAGWVYRRNIEIHKRVMLMATVIGLAPPGISRLPLLEGHTPFIAATVMLVILMGPLFDFRKYGKVHKAYYFSLPFTFGILPPIVEAASQTEIWTRLCSFII